MPTFLSLVALVSFKSQSFAINIWFLGLLWKILSFFFSCGVLVFQQLEIDYVIGESNKDLLPDSSGSAAIIRVFGVTREGIFSKIF